MMPNVVVDLSEEPASVQVDRTGRTVVASLDDVEVRIAYLVAVDLADQLLDVLDERDIARLTADRPQPQLFG